MAVTFQVSMVVYLGQCPLHTSACRLGCTPFPLVLLGDLLDGWCPQRSMTSTPDLLARVSQSSHSLCQEPSSLKVGSHPLLIWPSVAHVVSSVDVATPQERMQPYTRSETFSVLCNSLGLIV